MLDRLTPGQPQFDPILCAMAALLLILFVSILLLALRIGSLRRRYGQLLVSPSGANLEELLREYLVSAQAARDASARIAGEVETLSAALPGCLQRVGVVRYDAFEDVGGRLSFSVALADARGSGMLITSVYGREGCRIYAKNLELGKSETPLSEEEREAVRKAMNVSQGSPGKSV